MGHYARRALTPEFPPRPRTLTLAEALERASKDGRPTVLLYFADFDPSGHQMSISVARKVQAHIDFQYPNLDIKLYRVALTIDQVRAWGLPDKPIPPKEKRATVWREAFGAEQTEIDAAIELAPEQLRAAIFEAIRPFYDDTLDQRVEHVAEVWQQKADDLLRGHPDYGACRQRIADAFERLQIAVAELTDEQERAGEILKQTEPEPPESLKAEPSGTAKTALFDSKNDFVTAALRLIADKRLIASEPDDEEDDVE
jgi:hypothetical protein